MVSAMSCVRIVLAGWAAAVLASCSAPSDRDRAVVEARTCIALLERSGRDTTSVDVGDFETALERFRTGDQPYSTLEPFLRACPLRG